MKALALLAALVCACLLKAAELSEADVIWTSPSQNSSESMPVGGGDVGLNVWVEKGELLFYVSQSGTFDENNCMLKLGRVRLKVGAGLFEGPEFRQELRLSESCVFVHGAGLTARIWVDAKRPVVHVEIDSKEERSLSLAYENWRFAEQRPGTMERMAGSLKFNDKLEVVTRPDKVEFRENAILFTHRNAGETAFDLTVRQQGLEAVKSQLFDPLVNRQFGGRVEGTGLIPDGQGEGEYCGTPFRSHRLRSAKPARHHEVQLLLHVAQTPTAAAWDAGLEELAAQVRAAGPKAWEETQAWWRAYWERSFIYTDAEDPKVRQLGLNYQRFRYMMGCNARGEFPTKFNGGLFTFDPVFVRSDSPFTPDFRRWGGGLMTAQNQRLVYFPLFRSGDFDLLKPQFDFYLRALRNAELRSELYWGHKGACFTEQLESFGLPNSGEYAWKRPAGFDPGLEYNAWLEYTWDTVLEFCLMMLDTERYEGRDLTPYLPFIDSCLTFFDEHYRMLARQRGTKEFNDQGHYVLFPGSAAETYKMAYNSTTTISALRVVLDRLLALPATQLDEGRRVRFAAMRRHVPPLPLREIEGRRVLAPAQVWERVQNSEIPQLYPVFPWGLYGIGQPEIEVARNTYFHDPQAVKYRGHEGWRQSSIFAARLGLAEEAARMTLAKLQDSEKHRFPSFWGPGFDWTPDHNWGGSGILGLQEMLMQCVGDKIYLLPAWPKTWSAHFRLHAPHNTVVEARVVQGKLQELKVSPESRRGDVICLEAQ